MISSKILARFLHFQKPFMAAEKSLLATLRKRTGYTFANCKKALELHNNDLKQAEIWLKQQAQSLGWAKATKLEGRQTSQGLVGLVLNKTNAAVIEVNCETDFVARNQEFQKFVQEATSSCLNFVEKEPENQNLVSKIFLNGDNLKNLAASDGKSLADHLALMIGSVGENASLKRGFGLKVQPDIYLAGYVHPSGNDNSILLGKIGGLVALRQTSTKNVDLDKIGKELCQHIVGMNPKRIGSSSDEPVKNKDEEICLIHQEFLLDESVTVKEILDENEIEVLDFKRIEVGESEGVIEQRLENLETCQ